MCSVTAGVMAAAAIMQQGAQYQAGKERAHAINAQLATTEEQIKQSNTAKLNARQRLGHMKIAHDITTAGESGAGGNSFEAMLQNAIMTKGTDMATIEKNNALQQKAAYAQAAYADSGIQIPTVLSAGAQIGSAAYSGYQYDQVH